MQISPRDLEKRRSVYEVAATVFAQYGFRRTTMNDIAQAAGMSRPALYLMFDNKEHLFHELSSYRLDQAIDQACKVLSGDASVEDRFIDALLVYEKIYYEPVANSPHGEELMDINQSLATERGVREAGHHPGNSTRRSGAGRRSQLRRSTAETQGFRRIAAGLDHRNKKEGQHYGGIPQEDPPGLADIPAGNFSVTAAGSAVQLSCPPWVCPVQPHAKDIPAPRTPTGYSVTPWTAVLPAIRIADSSTSKPGSANAITPSQPMVASSNPALSEPIACNPKTVKSFIA